MGDRGFLLTQVKAVHGNAEGNKGTHFHGSTAIGAGEQIIGQHGGRVHQEKQPGSGHVVGPQSQGGAAHGEAGEQAVKPIPGEQGAAQVEP